MTKYKLEFKVSLNNQKIGYVDSQKDIDSYIEEKIAQEEGKNIAFVELENSPSLQLELVSRNLEQDEDALKEQITNLVQIEYTNYAITVDGENKTYFASKEEAEQVVTELKEKYDEKYTNTLGIVQVYSNDYEEIASIQTDKAKEVITEVLDQKVKENKKATNQTRITLAQNRTSTKTNTLNGITFSVKPVSGMITSRFGRRSSPGGIGSTNHKGLDIAAKAGTSIQVVATGTVTFAGYKGSLGKLVIINHGNGVETYYGHCSKINVSKGQKVNAGDVIAAVGKTGSATGYHLHLEIHKNGVAVNPQNYLY